MASIIGFGGTFLRASDPAALYAWYGKHLALPLEKTVLNFPAGQGTGPILAFFKPDNAYFPVSQPAMLNLRVDDLDGMLDELTAAGVTVDPRREDYGFGRFGWFTDPEGNRVELWQPAAK